MTPMNENTPAAGQGNEGNEQIRETNSADQPTDLNHAIVIALFEMIVDTRFRDRDEMILSSNLTLQDVEEICRRFEIPLKDVLEIARIGADS